MPPKGTGAPYQNGRRWWGNFESFADVGGKREPLIPPGAKQATESYEVALKLYVDRRAHYMDLRTQGVYTGVSSDVSPAAYAKTFLDRLKVARRSDGKLKHDERGLARRHRALSTCLKMPSMRAARRLAAVNRNTISALITELQTHEHARTPRGKALSPSTVRSHLMELSAMFTRAVFDGVMKTHPLREHPDIPPLVRGRALKDDEYLTRSEVRGLLENVLPSTKNPWAVEQTYILFYTGCRLDELNGLLVEDLDFERKRVWVREYDHRGLKTETSKRGAPMWPKLEAVLRASLSRKPRARGQLAFPTPGARADEPLEEQMMTRLRSSLSAAARRAGIEKKLKHHIARHSYVTARRSMVELDALGVELNVRDEVIIREVGHGTAELIETTYGHVAQERVKQTLLDYGDAPPDFDERRARWRAEFSARVKLGLAKRGQRVKDVARTAASE